MSGKERLQGKNVEVHVCLCRCLSEKGQSSIYALSYLAFFLLFSSASLTKNDCFGNDPWWAKKRGVMVFIFRGSVHAGILFNAAI
jgi:hypothetical protein